LSECDNVNDSQAYEVLEALLETEGDCSSEDGIDLSESEESIASDDSEDDPDFSPESPPRTRGSPFIQMYSRKHRPMSSIQKSNPGSFISVRSNN